MISKISRIIVICFVLLIYTSCFETYGQATFTPYFTFNNCDVSFDPNVTVVAAPYQRPSNDSSLVNYWKFDESLGSFAVDSGVGGKNGTVYNATRVTGKWGDALSFNASNGAYVLLPPASVPTFKNTRFSMAAWVKISGFDFGDRVTIIGSTNSLAPVMCVMKNGQLTLLQTQKATQYSTLTVPVDKWVFLAIVVDRSTQKVTFCVNNQLDTQTLGSDFSSFTGQINGLGTYLGLSTRFMNGLLDDVRLYNRTLSTKELSTLSTMGPFAGPDSQSYVGYYNFTDPLSGNTLLMQVNNIVNQDSTSVFCSNFFTDNKIVFGANNTATANIWTSLGQPMYSTGIWNNENCTSTLVFDSSSNTTLSWKTCDITTYTDAHSTVFPSNVTVGYGGDQTFNFNASQGYHFMVAVDNVSQGQINNYTFRNITMGHIVNVFSSQFFAIDSTCSGNGSITPSELVPVDYGQNQTFTFIPDEGYHVSKILSTMSRKVSPFRTLSTVLSEIIQLLYPLTSTCTIYPC